MDRCGVQRPGGQGRQLRCSLVVLLCGGVAAWGGTQWAPYSAFTSESL